MARGATSLVLPAYNVPEQLLTAVMTMYHNTNAAVITPHGVIDIFATSSRVLHGDSLAPFLFPFVLNWVLRTALPSNDDGRQISRSNSSHYPEKRLALLVYADDLALLASSPEGAQRLLEGLLKVAATVGLRINTKKTEVFTIPSNLPANRVIPAFESSRASPFSRCQEVRYLGGMLPGTANDLRRAWAAFTSISSEL